MKRPTTNAQPSDTTNEANATDVRQIKLMLHTVDGTIPLITPSLLQQCFPPEETGDSLILGIAVRDTCLVPVFDTDPTKRDVDSKDSAVKNRTKPRSYEFSSSFQPDSWLLNYQRISVPTFDPLRDATNISPKTPLESACNATNQHVTLWTENGRHPITPQKYFESVEGLGSHTFLSLFDTSPPGAGKRRTRSAFERTQQWLFDATNGIKEKQIKSKEEMSPKKNQQKVWAPFLIQPDDADESISLVTSQLRKAIHTLLDDQESHLAGVVLVGWQRAMAEKQKATLSEAIKIFRDPARTQPPSLAVLSTSSLLQVMDAAILGVDLIGTNLPTEWAKSKKVFACDILGWRKNVNEHKRPKLLEETPHHKLDVDGCFTLEDKNFSKWEKDKQPIVPGCTCLACTKHSRSYILHLVRAKELLAETLIFIHNLHHMLLLLSSELSIALTEGKEDQFYTHMLSQLPQPTEIST